ncbi:site-specific integrase [Staphylococcus succinus]|uniref:site-specific integrase n=1 Tax=Staphylococcus succinus TaxID=61015 RepID=UPI0024801E41|nr:site-specific integrase [Staphylococcus succinus]MDH9161480.1 site-specific integrase [Staphylococcus succinus]
MPVYKDEQRGTYYYSVSYKDIYGNNKRKVKRGFTKKKDAKIAESDFIQKVKFGYSDNKTFDEIFHTRLKSVQLSERSIEKRTTEYNKYIKKQFGFREVGKITTEQCKQLRDALMNDFDLSLSYARSVWAGFKAVFKYACKYYKLTVDPTLPVEPIPRVKPKPIYITRDDFDERVEGITNTRSQNLAKLLFYSGLRVGEAMALTWNDFDSEKHELNINKTLHLTRGKIQDTVKTETSFGSVPIPMLLNTLLCDMYEHDKGSNSLFTDDYYIFGGYNPMSYQTFTRHFKMAFPDNKIHSLRHSYASYLINNGVDMYLLMKLMRHSNINETIGTYSHLYPDKTHEVVKIFDEK